MTAANWTPAAESITTADASFFTSADLVLAAKIDLPHSPAQIWGALTDDRLCAWMPIVDRGRWIDPPPRSRGARTMNSPILRLIPRLLTRPMCGLSRRAPRGIVTVPPSPGAPVGAECG